MKTIVIITSTLALLLAGLAGGGFYYVKQGGQNPFAPPSGELEARVLAEERQEGRLVLTLQVEDARMLATFTERADDVELLVNVGDIVTLGLAGPSPLVDEPNLIRVAREGSGDRELASALARESEEDSEAEADGSEPEDTQGEEGQGEDSGEEEESAEGPDSDSTTETEGTNAEEQASDAADGTASEEASEAPESTRPNSGSRGRRRPPIPVSSNESTDDRQEPALPSGTEPAGRIAAPATA